MRANGSATVEPSCSEQPAVLLDDEHRRPRGVRAVEGGKIGDGGAVAVAGEADRDVAHPGRHQGGVGALEVVGEAVGGGHREPPGSRCPPMVPKAED